MLVFPYVTRCSRHIGWQRQKRTKLQKIWTREQCTKKKQFAPFVGLLNKLIHKILAGINASVSRYIQKAFMCQTGSLWALTFDKLKLDLKKV